MERFYTTLPLSFRDYFPTPEQTRALGEELNMWVAEHAVTPYIISPHPDDMELSMSGEAFLLNQISEGRLTHVIVFSESTEGLSEVRKDEVRDAGNILNISAHNTHFLGEVDFAHRNAWLHHIPSRRGRNLLSSVPYPIGVEKALVKDLERKFADFVYTVPNYLAFVPLDGLRRHRDHTLVKIASERVFAPDSMVYYDEYPYHRGLLPSGRIVFRMLAGLATFEENQDKRVEAIEAFPSQIPSLFPNGFPVSLPPEKIYIPQAMRKKMLIS